MDVDGRAKPGHDGGIAGTAIPRLAARYSFARSAKRLAATVSFETVRPEPAMV